MRPNTKESRGDKQTQFSGTGDVRDQHRFDEANLHAWMQSNVEGFAGPLTVEQFKGGQSNPTYKLITPGQNYVMRRKPPGTLLASAHAVDREYRVITALYGAGFPVARTFGLCMDESVLGRLTRMRRDHGLTEFRRMPAAVPDAAVPVSLEGVELIPELSAATPAHRAGRGPGRRILPGGVRIGRQVRGE